MTFGSKAPAGKVVDELKTLSGRQVAVDWAIEKSEYLTKHELLGKQTSSVPFKARPISGAYLCKGFSCRDFAIRIHKRMYTSVYVRV